MFPLDTTSMINGPPSEKVAFFSVDTAVLSIGVLVVLASKLVCQINVMSHIEKRNRSPYSWGSEIHFVQKDNATRQILTYTTQLNSQPTNCKEAVVE